MSIIMGPYEKEACLQTEREDDELFVFGYACKLFRDDTKALLEASGQLLIPWMGYGSLMVDRYDIRNRLYDKSLFGLKPNLPRRMTAGEEEMEDVLDRERYLGLDTDILEHELQEEEAEKRSREGGNGFKAVGFNYDSQPPPEETTPPLPRPPHRPEHPSTSNVDVVGREAPFIKPAGLVVPGHIKLPATAKLHSIVQKTALFVAERGVQMEIMIKAKQKFNPFFSFLSLYDPLYPYYKHLLQFISSGKYVVESENTPKVVEERKEEKDGECVKGEREEGGREDGEEARGNGGVEDAAHCGEDSSDEGGESDSSEGFELHPLLRVSKSVPHKQQSHQVPPKPPASSSPSTSPPHSPSQNNNDATSFYSQRLSVNSAPSLERERGAVASWNNTPSPNPPYPYPQPHHSSHHAAAGDEPGYPHSNHHPSYQCAEDYSYPNQSDYADQYSLEAYYHTLSAQHISRMAQSDPFPGPPPPPPDLQPVIDKTAEYVARNSEQFERTVLEHHCGDPRFGFLNPWDKYFAYYKQRLQQFKESFALEVALYTQGQQQPTLMEGEEECEGKSERVVQVKNIQRLSESGTVRFRLEPKPAKVLEAPALSTIDEEDEEEKEEEEEREEEEKREEEVDGEEHLGREQEEESVVSSYQHHPTHEPTLAPYWEEHTYSTSAEGVYYNREELGHEAPPAKRQRTAADSKNLVMDYKVKEFLNEVKAVLDS